MNSLKTMVKMEDEVGLIASIYVMSIKLLVSNKQTTNPYSHIIYIHRVDEALRLIDEHHRRVIQNDFINHKHQWWKHFYSADRYLSLRHEAVGSFLTHFYEG